MKPVLYRYRDSEWCVKPMEGSTPSEGWTPLYDQAAIDAAVAAAQCVKPPRTEGETMTDREAFEAWAGIREKYHTTREWDAMHRAWQAATAAERERERCAMPSPTNGEVPTLKASSALMQSGRLSDETRNIQIADDRVVP